MLYDLKDSPLSLPSCVAAFGLYLGLGPSPVWYGENDEKLPLSFANVWPQN